MAIIIFTKSVFSHRHEECSERLKERPELSDIYLCHCMWAVSRKATILNIIKHYHVHQILKIVMKSHPVSVQATK